MSSVPGEWSGRRLFFFLRCGHGVAVVLCGVVFLFFFGGAGRLVTVLLGWSGIF